MPQIKKTFRGIFGYLLVKFAVIAFLPNIGQTQILLYELNGDFPEDQFGRSVSIAGDINSDGHDDILVGSPFDGKNGFRAGLARVYSGKDGSTLFELYGDTMNGWFGMSVSDAGDINKDGHDDFIICGLAHQGVNKFARVFSGKDGSVLFTFSDSMAHSVVRASGAGDTNGDGYPDIIVGFPSGRSHARVFSGKDGSTLHTFTLEGDTRVWTSNGGDINNDGYADVMVGAPDIMVNGFPSSGKAFVFSGFDGSTLYSIDGAWNEAIGFNDMGVADAGDINKDGYDDFVISGVSSSKVYSGVDGTIIYIFSVPAVGGGDVDGDSYPDIIARGSVFSGKDGTLLYTADFSGAYSIDGNGDINNDGLADFVAGSINAAPSSSGFVKVFSGKPDTSSDSTNPPSSETPSDPNNPPDANIPNPCSTEIGVSINQAALYTKSPEVELCINYPAGTRSIKISNDGGFSGATEISPATSVSWRIISSGSERLPKTVYVRFGGPGIDGSQTYSDDIILDETPPEIESGKGNDLGRKKGKVVVCHKDDLTPEGQEIEISASALDGHIKHGDTLGPCENEGNEKRVPRNLDYLLRKRKKTKSKYQSVSISVEATDSNSGVSQMRFLQNQKAITSWITYSKKTLITAEQRKPIFVEIKDSAGNISNPKRIRLKRKRR